jgi:hypothetical protein
MIYISKIASRKANDTPPKSNKTAPAPLPDFNMNVSVGPKTEAFIVVVPPAPFARGAPKLPEAAAELVMTGTLPLRAGVAPPPLSATGACIALGPDATELSTTPGAPVVAVALVGMDALPGVRPFPPPVMEAVIGTIPVAAANEAAAPAEAIALVSGHVIVTVAGMPPSPQTAQALVEMVIGMVGTGVSVHPQCRLVMIVVIVVRPCSHTSHTSTHTATGESLDANL